MFSKKIKEKLKHYFHLLASSENSEHSIALGFAIGTFIAILPTLGVDVLIGVLVVLVFPKINKLSLFGAMAFWNPIMMVPIYLLSYGLGGLISKFLLPEFYFSSTNFFLSILGRAYDFSRAYLIGNLLLAIVLSTAGYFIVRQIAISYKKNHKK